MSRTAEIRVRSIGSVDHASRLGMELSASGWNVHMIVDFDLADLKHRPMVKKGEDVDTKVSLWQIYKDGKRFKSPQLLTDEQLQVLGEDLSARYPNSRIDFVLAE